MKDKKLKKKNLKIKKIVPIIIIFLSLIGLAIGVTHYVFWHNDNKMIEEQIKEYEDDLVTEEVPATPDNEGVEVVNPPANTDNDYLNYINLPLLSVDFNSLIEKNNDTVAFIKVNGTNINYPVVQTTNNDYYLTHAYNKANNGAGWIFMDYRNTINDWDDNTIIYGHGRMNTTMFGSLKNVVKNKWYENTDNYVIYLSTEKENTLWQVFSVYQIPTETYYLISDFGTEESHQKYIDTALSRSIYNFNTEVNTNDKILTLSTCANDNEKVVLQAKLIKIQQR